MANKKARSADFRTGLCRLSYAQGLYKIRAAAEGAAEKYSCTLIFKKTDDRSLLENALRQVIVEEWGEKGLVAAKNGLIRSPFLDGMSKEAHNMKTKELNPGMGPDVFFIRVQANADSPPYVVWKDPNRQETEATVYSGCYGLAVINAFAWSHVTGGDGVSFGITGFQKTQEGEKIGGTGRPTADKYFEKIADTGEAAPAGASDKGAASLFG